MTLLPRVVAAIAGVQVLVATAAIIANLNAGGSFVLPAFVVGLVAAYSLGATFLLVAGRADGRAEHLGAIFASVASAFALPPARLALADEGGVWSAIAVPLAAIRVEALVPYLLWRFASAFPRLSGEDPYARFLGLGTRATWWVGLALIGANLLSVAVPDPPAPLRLVFRYQPGTLYWLVVMALALPTLVLMPLRDRHASRTEQRRVRVLLFGFAIGASPIVLFSLLDAVGLMENRALFVASTWVVYPSLIAVPFLTAYSVLVDRALDVRLLVRRAMQYALARYTLIGATALPAALIVVFVFVNRGTSVADLFSGGEAIVLVLLALTAGVTLRVRDRLVAALDRRFFREQYDARRILRGLVDEAREAVSASSLARLLVRQLDRAIHPTVVSVLLSRRTDGWFVGEQIGVRPLAPDGPLVTSLARTAGVRDLSRSRVPTSAEESAWLTDHGVRLVAPLLGKANALLGVVALGEKRSELPYTAEDRELIGAIASTASVSLENLTLFERGAPMHSMPQKGVEPSPARECLSCAAVQGTDGDCCRQCKGALRDAQLPAVLAGKFRVVRRLGAGGGGTVYLADDDTLGRRVALKALHTRTVEGSIRLQREARALATSSHPNLAVLFETETWQARTILVLEYLPGGSLAHRLEFGPLDPRRSLRVGCEIAEALSYLHYRGWLHRDVKPSNVGFTEEGTAKLLDFGLVQMMGAAATGSDVDAADGARPGPAITGPVPGTIPYLSPAAARGEPPTARDDLWGLAVLVCESITGINPFRGTTAASTLARIIEGRPIWPPPDSFARTPALEALLRRSLSPDPRDRPERADELRDAFTEIRTGPIG